MVHHMILYTCKEVKKMSNRNRKIKKEKSESTFETWLVNVLTDLLVGIILLIIGKLLK